MTLPLNSGASDLDSSRPPLTDFQRRLGVVPVKVKEAERRKVLLDRLTVIAAELTAETDEKTRKRLFDRQAKAKNALAEVEAAIAADRVTYQVGGRVMKGGALFIGAIAQYLRPV